MNSRFYDEEKERILQAIRAIMERFPQYIKNCDLNWPRCYKHPDVEMCQVLEKGKNSYFICFEYENGKACGHREFSI